MAFVNPYYLLFIALAAIFYFFLKTSRQKLLKINSNYKVFYRNNNINIGKFKIEFIFIAICLIIVSLARPYIGIEQHEIEKKGSNISLVFDVSNSMLAQDSKPCRLDQAKLAAKEILKEADISSASIIIFANKAAYKMPLTSDIESISSSIDEIGCNDLFNQGSNLSEALEMAQKSLEAEAGKSKTILVFSDFEDFAGGAENTVKNLSKDGATVCSIEIGSSNGAPIPINGDNNSSEFIKDKDGNLAISKANDQLAQTVASISNGSYSKIGDGAYGLASTINFLKNIKSDSSRKEKIIEKKELFQYPLFLALASILASIILPLKRNKVNKTT